MTRNIKVVCDCGICEGNIKPTFGDFAIRVAVVVIALGLGILCADPFIQAWANANI